MGLGAFSRWKPRIKRVRACAVTAPVRAARPHIVQPTWKLRSENRTGSTCTSTAMQERCLGQYLILPMDSLKSERPWWLNRRSKPECMARFGLVGRLLMGIILTRRRKVTSTTSLSTLPTAHSHCFPRLVTTEAQPSLPVRPHCDSTPNPMLADPGAVLMVFRFLDLLPHHPESLFQELGGLFAVGTLKPHGVDLDFASGPDNDFDGAVHMPTPMSTSLM